MKKIRVYGSSYSDICLRMGAVLAELGETVEMRIADPEAQLWLYLPRLRGSERGNITELGKVRFLTADENISEDASYGFEICGLDSYKTSGTEKPAEGENGACKDYILTITTEDPDILNRLEVLDSFGEFNNSEKQQNITILRNCTGILISKRLRTLKENTGILLELPVNKKDRRAELYLALREDLSYKRVSERFVSLIEKLVCTLRPETTVKEFEAAYKAAMRGGIV